jgi:hypothetical protein
MRWQTCVGFTLTIILAAIFLISCGGSSTQPGTVNLSLSDPATCAAPQGPFSHIYVTITDVQIHQSADASDNDAGWVHLAPALKNNPVQVDLLGVANQCFLAMLGSTGIQPGTYQQLRVFLAKDAVGLNNNKCVSPGVANCLMLTSDPQNTPLPLQLSSETQTGIKVPSGQIAGGKFVVGSGETKDLNLDFNACASIVFQGSGQYRLKPVLHAGEVSLTSASTAISGTIIDSTTKNPVVGGNTVVALEQTDKAGVDRVIMETVATSNGGFAFCPVSDGTYDVVVSAIDGAGNEYAATVITGVKPGDSLGTVPLTLSSIPNAPATITVPITTSTGSTGTVADLSVSALQSIGPNVLATIPLAQQSAATATVTTAPGLACPANTDCANQPLAVPASNPSVGTFISGGPQIPNAPATGSVNYTVDANAFVPLTAGLPDCSPSNMQTSQDVSTAILTVTPGVSVTSATLAFTSCQ